MRALRARSVCPVGVVAHKLPPDLSSLVTLSLVDVAPFWLKNSVAECRDVLRKNPGAAVLATIPHSDESEDLEHLTQLRNEFPHSAWVGLFVDGYSDFKALACLGGHGVREIVPAEGLRALGRLPLALVSSETASVAERICQLARLDPGDPLSTVLSAAIRIAHAPASMVELATTMRRHERTIRRYCDQHGLVSPQWSIGWARCLHTAYYLEETGRTVQSIASVLSFETGATLSNHLRRYTGHSATELRQLGAMATVARLAKEKLRLDRTDVVCLPRKPREALPPREKP